MGPEDLVSQFIATVLAELRTPSDLGPTIWTKAPRGDMFAFISPLNLAIELVMMPPIMITAPTKVMLNPTDSISEFAKKTVMDCVLAVVQADPDEAIHWMYPISP